MKSKDRTFIPLAQKIEIFREYFSSAKPGTRLTGNTVFKEYPLGVWAIRLRSEYKNKNRTFLPDDLSFLIDSGILDRQIEATIDEKIDALIEWKANHPDIVLSYANDNYINNYLASREDIGEKEKNKLLEYYKKMQRYLAYVKHRTYEKKLTKTQLNKLKNANFDTSYGYSDEIEQLALKYRIRPSKIKYILDKYGSMDKFITKYRDGKLKEDLNFFRRVFNIDYENANMDDLVYELYINATASKYSTVFYSGKYLETVISTLEERMQQILIAIYGLDTNSKKTQTLLGQEFNISQQYVGIQKNRGLRKLRSNGHNFLFYLDEEALDEFYKSNAFFNPDEEYLDIPCDLNTNELIIKFKKREIKRLQNTLKEFAQLSNEEINTLMVKPIRILNLSPQTNYLLRRAGINTVATLVRLTDEEVRQIETLGNKDCEEIIEILHNLPQEIILKQQEAQKIAPVEIIAEKSIDILNLSVRSHNCLKRSRITTIGELQNLTEEDLLHIRNLGRKGVGEILTAIANLQQTQISEPQEETIVANTPTVLETQREQRNKLQIELDGLNSQIAEATKLLDIYNLIIAKQESSANLISNLEPTNLAELREKRDSLHTELDSLMTQVKNVEQLLNAHHTVIEHEDTNSENSDLDGQ